jgi:hypothetical protein
MFIILLETGFIVTGAIYLICSGVGVRRRRRRAWETLVTSLQPNRGDAELSQYLNWDKDLFVTPEEKWRGINGAQGLWAMFENAGVMLEMANYAAINSTETDPELIAALRRDAIQVRILVVVALSKCACGQVNESTCAIVSRATAYYVDMTKRTVELAQLNGRALAPGFAASM